MHWVNERLKSTFLGIVFPLAFIISLARPRVPDFLTAGYGLQGVVQDRLVTGFSGFGVCIDGLLGCCQEEEYK